MNKYLMILLLIFVFGCSRKINNDNSIVNEFDYQNQETATLITAESTFLINQSSNLLNTSNLLNNFGAITELLSATSATQENPISLKLSISLGTMTEAESNWRRLLRILDDAGKYVALDLSSCSIAGIDFNPVSGVQTGKWFIVSLVLPDVAKNIPSGTTRGSTFNYFYNLRTLSGKEINSIGVYAFNDCNDLNISFSTMTKIDENTFSGFVGLTGADFPLAVDIGENAFADCTNLVNINFPSAMNIGKNAFANCTSLINVIFPAAVNIGENAFNGCAGLIDVNFPVAKTINRNAFKDCINLSRIIFPSILVVESGSFANCTSLTSVNFPTAITLGSNYYGTVGAFQNCSNLLNASFPSVTTISNYTFLDCTRLTEINFPVALIIGEGAFQNCISLTNANFPSVTHISRAAFLGCTALTSVNLPMVRSINVDYDIRIGTGPSFYGCINLISITIGEHYDNNLSLTFPGDFFSKYREGGAGTYTRSIGSNSWTKQ